MNGKSTEITLTPVITAGAYSANDVAGGLLVFTLPDAFPVSGIIRSIRVVDDDNELSFTYSMLSLLYLLTMPLSALWLKT